MLIFIGVVGFVVIVLVVAGMILITPYGTVSVDDPDSQGSELSGAR